MSGNYCFLVFLFSAFYTHAGETPNRGQAMRDPIIPSILRQFVIDKQFEIAKENNVQFTKVLISVKGKQLSQAEICRGHFFYEMGAETEQDIKIIIAY